MDMNVMNDRVARNVDMLRALRGIRTRADLARMMEMDTATLSRVMSGKQQWTLENLTEVAKALSVEPGAILGSPSELVGSADHVATAATTSSRQGYLTRKPARIAEIAQVTDLHPRKTDVAQTDAPNGVNLPHAA